MSSADEAAGRAGSADDAADRTGRAGPGDWDERVAVARACRILAHRGLVEDVLGHISLRVSADRILLRCRGPHERGLRFTADAARHF